ncbi:hypothetical protein AB0J80_25730 [Actinoplanes sp. NPDC049548]|uniref:hypothetical protein n=1 Tax=Actinoplanes sp. NPDC049548 TaxID=3155152 RepID=UPI00343BFD43
MLLRLLSVLLAAGLAGLTVPAKPAAAAPAPPRLNTVFDPITIAPGTPEDEYTANLYGLLAEREQPVRVHRVAYTVDVTDAADLVSLSFAGLATDIITASAFDDDESPCVLKGTVFRCVRTGVRPSAGFIVQLGFFEVTPAPGAEPGDTGRISVTARVDDGPVTTSTSQVRIGENVDLAAVGGATVSAAPGHTATFRPRVRNVGDKAAEGAVLSLPFPRDVVVTDASNCFYGYAVYCVFDTVLEPGRTYGLSAPVTVRPPGDAAVGSRADAQLRWMTPSLWEDWLTAFKGSLPGKAGTGEPLTLVAQASAAGIPQVDIGSDNDYAVVKLTVTGSRRPDLAAKAPAVTLKAGGTTTVRIAAVNRGPGTLYPALFDNTMILTSLTVPKGVTASTTNSRCWSNGGDTRRWQCSPAKEKVAPGGSETYTFRLKAARSFTGGTGKVRVSGFFSAPLDAPANRANNVTNLRINLPASGQGAGLPVTGPVLWPGLFLVLVGSALVLAGRYVRTYAG